jgi:hypothetical protein
VCKDEEDRVGADLRSAVTTEEAFQEALRQLVIEADSNGVDVRGGWPVERTDAERARELVVTEISGRSTATTEDSEFPASAVVDAVAERECVDPTDLPHYTTRLAQMSSKSCTRPTPTGISV